MRWLLVQAAWAALRSRRADAAPLRAWAEQLAKRRGSRIATVALARRLAGILFAMWRNHATFEFAMWRNHATFEARHAAAPAGTTTAA